MPTSNTMFSSIPEWNANTPKDNFRILGDEVNGQIPVTRLEHWNDFRKIIASDLFESNGNEWVFRGQKRYNWGLEPTLERICTPNSISREFAQKQLDLFRKTIRGRINDHSLLTESNTDDNDDELWSVGQHHGLATPLLDWTSSPYVALFFAFLKKDEEENLYRSIFVLNKTFVAKHSTPDGLRIFEPKKDDHGRLVSQAGLFTYSDYDSPIETSIAKALEDELESCPQEEEAAFFAKHLCKIYIRNKDQAECIRHLRKMNIHHASLFPDIIGASEYCNHCMVDFQEQASTLEETQSKKTLGKPSTELKQEFPYAHIKILKPLRALILNNKLAQRTSPQNRQRFYYFILRLIQELPSEKWKAHEDLQATLRNKIRLRTRIFHISLDAQKAFADEIMTLLINEL